VVTARGEIDHSGHFIDRFDLPRGPRYLGIPANVAATFLFPSTFK
jgi:hypothetical protein